MRDLPIRASIALSTEGRVVPTAISMIAVVRDKDAQERIVRAVAAYFNLRVERL